MNRLIAVLVLSLLLLAAGAGAVLLLRHRGPTQVVAPTAAVITAMHDLARLETAEYHVERVIDLKDQQEVLFGLIQGEDAVLLIAAGDVVAGVDLSHLGPADVSFDQKTRALTVRLPAPEVFSARLDDHRTHVHTRRTDLLATRDEQLEGRAREIAVDSFRRAAIEGGILDRARAQAERVVRTVLRQAGAERVAITWQ